MNKMPDTVFIEGLAAEAVIGVFDWERKIKQRLLLDLELATDINLAAATDDLTHTLDYKAISDRMLEIIEASDFQLLEALAGKLADTLLNEFQVPWLRLKLSKPGAVPAASNVGLIIERGRRS